MSEQLSPQENREVDHNVGWISKQAAEGYDEKRFASLPGRIFNTLEMKAISKCLRIIESTGPVDLVLDVPCGTGRISELLIERGHKVVCGDISESMMAVARKKMSGLGKHEPEFVKLDVYDLDYESDALDCVTCIRLFQHLTSEQRARVLTELARVTKRYVIYNATYTSRYYGVIRRIRKMLGRYAPRYTMSKEEMTRELLVSGLRKVTSIFPQPGYNGNVVILAEKTGNASRINQNT